VLWSHLHTSYQTSVTLLLANLLPPVAWTLFQIMTLTLESFAPLWFSWNKTRPYALLAAVGMHAMIGLACAPSHGRAHRATGVRTGPRACAPSHEHVHAHHRMRAGDQPKLPAQRRMLPHRRRKLAA
jgi:hypothetical protein